MLEAVQQLSLQFRGGWTSNPQNHPITLSEGDGVMIHYVEHGKVTKVQIRGNEPC